jgi:hypothetical protein
MEHHPSIVCYDLKYDTRKSWSVSLQNLTKVRNGKDEKKEWRRI